MSDSAYATDVGRERHHNEDSVAVVPLVDGVLCAVADGMGGHAAGEIASQLAIDAMVAIAPQIRAGQSGLQAILSAAGRAHRAILDAARDGREGMGCTLTVAALRPDSVEVLHIGDSRAYRIENSSIAQLTRDHTMVEQMVRENILTPEQARTHPARNYLMRALGVDPVQFDTETFERDGHEVFLLCSDGLTGHLQDAEILKRVNCAASLDDAVQDLVRAANEGGGSDNITVVLAR